METLITVLIVAAAGFFLVRRIRGVVKGEGCGCGKCDGGCGKVKKG